MLQGLWRGIFVIVLAHILGVIPSCTKTPSGVAQEMRLATTVSSDSCIADISQANDCWQDAFSGVRSWASPRIKGAVCFVGHVHNEHVIGLITAASVYWQKLNGNNKDFFGTTMLTTLADRCLGKSESS